MVGRRPTPTAYKITRGIPGRRPLPENEPKPEIGLPNIPEFLNEIALKIWMEEGPGLIKAGLLSKIDGTAFAAYCMSKSEWIIMINFVAEVEKPGERKLVKGTLIKRRDDAERRMHRWAVELGITPSSRSRVKAMPLAEPESEGTDYLAWSNGNQN
jgi:P27 family predicted phage terminase small subunit